MQLSVDTHDFVIDTVKLYEHIQEYLPPIFMNRSIIKIFFGTCDLPWLQRDYNIFLNSFVDVQNVYDKKSKNSNHSSFAFVVKDLLNIELDKKWQSFPWQMRKLPSEAIRYARLDSKLLYKVWASYERYVCTIYFE